VSGKRAGCGLGAAKGGRGGTGTGIQAGEETNLKGDEFQGAW